MSTVLTLKGQLEWSLLITLVKQTIGLDMEIPFQLGICYYQEFTLAV